MEINLLLIQQKIYYANIITWVEIKYKSKSNKILNFFVFMLGVSMYLEFLQKTIDILTKTMYNKNRK